MPILRDLPMQLIAYLLSQCMWDSCEVKDASNVSPPSSM
jgi:hypothetical protein